MADDLDSFVTAFVGVLGAMTGVVDAPEYPPEKLVQFPVVVSYYVSGRPGARPEIWVHTFHGDVHLSRSNLPKDEKAARPYILRGLEAFFANTTMSGTCASCLPMKVEYGRLDYGEQKTFGVRFIVEVKIQHGGISVG